MKKISSIDELREYVEVIENSMRQNGIVLELVDGGLVTTEYYNSNSSRRLSKSDFIIISNINELLELKRQSEEPDVSFYINIEAAMYLLEIWNEDKY